MAGKRAGQRPSEVPDGTRPGPLTPPDGESQSAHPGEVRAGTPASPGSFCWSCDRYAVDAPGDLCDWCVDIVSEELAGRLLGRGW